MKEATPTPAAETPTPAAPVPRAPEAPATTSGETAPAPPASAPPSPAVLALGFVIMALLGALLFVSFQSKVVAPVDDEAELAARIRKDTDSLLSLHGRNRSSLSEKDALLSAKENELRDSERTKCALLNQCATLKSDLDKALANNTSGDLFKAQLAEANKQLANLSADLSKARAQLADYANRPSSEDLGDLRRRLEESDRAKAFYETQVKELEAKLHSLAAAPPRLFASSEAELLPLGLELYHSLQKLENSSDAEILRAYSDFRSTLGAKVVKNFSFPTGSYTPAQADETALREAVQALPDDGLLLVVGYASKLGSHDDNQKLSSERATAVAKSLDSIKLPNQRVQAVYLGETDRFGRTEQENNQLCEVWQIRTKN